MHMREKTRDDFDGLQAAWQTAAGTAVTFWCDLMHDSPMWPIHGQYECRTCGRRYFVPWVEDAIQPGPAELADVEPAHLPPHGAPSLRSALLPPVMLLAIPAASHVKAAEATAFAHYPARPEHSIPVSIETIEAEAAAPKLEMGRRSSALQAFHPTKGILS